MSLPRIAITMGDPAGVGPEICLDLLADKEVASDCVPIVFGDRAVLEACAEKTGKALPTSFCAESEIETVSAPSVFHIESIGLTDFEPGTVNAATGKAAYSYITKSIDLALAGSIDGVATAPINKEALSSAGITQPGHTEIFAERSGTERYCMMLTSEIITCSLVTIHVGYDEVPELLTEERILEVIELTREAMARIRGREPKMVVCGLNPHAGEGGLFGNREEERMILPAIESARHAGANIEGPLPADTAFLKWRRAETDAYVCMYHDQGLIPLKALAFDEAINTTLGLPIVRTSVDHGTALDIAWQGKASSRSLLEAVRLAAKMSER
ncbi:4-hydroxythreonine-4-phosphate dehydrogenase PdxA [Verrucomicrobiales bacterium]|jgi:4-phospho-D-threonate 3-dehydrogenase / 4-phospho-D-erythronate 3-dehydrogenase|nr:4-hydroxythreonine-4-phosphate dehydrogenase PdxA [Verrucomicrobiales bacterium]